MNVGMRLLEQPAGSQPIAAQSLLRQAGIRSIALVSADSETLVKFRGHLIDMLRADGITVSYVGPAVDAATRNWLAARAIPIREIPISRNKVAPLADLRTFFALWRALRGLAPDTVLTLRVKATVYGIIAAALTRVPHRFAFITGLGYAFVERPGDVRWRLTNLAVRSLYGHALRRATAVAFQNVDDQKDFREWRLVPVHLPSAVTNGSGVDTTFYAETPLPERMNCLLAARLLSDKGIGELIEAARIVKMSRPDISFTIIGPTETNPSAFPMERLRAAAAEGLIEYAGAVSDVRPFIASCRIFVLPSYYREGTPRSILEAMAMGRPIVTTDVPGCRDTVETGRNGLLVPPRDPAALAAAILELAHDSDRVVRMGRESRRIAEKKYEIQRVTRDLLDFCGRAASRHES